MKIIPLLILILLSLGPSEAMARTIFFGSEPETIPIASGGPTILRFPSEVKTISQAKRFKIEPANPDTPNYALLSIEPRVPTGQSDVIFILNDGTIIKTRLKIIGESQPEKGDSIFEFKSKESLLPNDMEKPGSTINISELDLMKALIRGDAITGYEVRSLVRKISPGFKGVETKLIKICTGSNFNGYVFELKNTTNRELFVNIQNLAIGDPNVALLSNVDHPVLGPENSLTDRAVLRIVAKSNSLFNQLILPIQITEKKGEK